MSQLARALFNEFRPFTNILDDPFDSSLYSSSRGQRQFPDPFNWQASRPALNLSEDEDGRYVVEAEVPGVKRENLDVRIGDGGRSLTVEGQVVRKARATNPGFPATSADKSSSAASDAQEQSTALTTAQNNDTTVGQYNGSWSGSRSFTRTVWLPHPVNASDVTAKLEDGILTIRAGKANTASVNVTVD